MKHTSYVGIDISDSSIKVLRLDKNTIVAYGSAQLPPGVVTNGRINDIDAFSEIINGIFDTTHPHPLDREDGVMRAMVCLPESKLFSHYVKIPETVPAGEVRKFIQEDSSKTIPFNLEELYWDYRIAYTKAGKHAVFISAEKQDLDNYVEALTHARIRPVFVGSELFSLGRSILPDDLGEKSHMIIDIGGRSTTLGIFNADPIANISVRIPIAGHYFTRVLKDALNVEDEEAEKRKAEYGLRTEDTQIEVLKALESAAREIITEIQEAKEFYEEKTGETITCIWLAGGSALMPGLREFIERETGIETKIADPLSKIANPEVLTKDTPSLFYSTVIGLALLGSNMDLPHINLLTQYQYKDKNIRERLTRLRDVRSVEDFEFVFSRLMHRMKNMFHNEKRPFFKFRLNPRAFLIIIFFLASITFLGVVIAKYLV